MLQSAPIVKIWHKKIFSVLLFLSFAFFSMKTTWNNIISTHLGSWEIGPQFLYCGKIGLKKSGASPKRVNDTGRQHEITDTPQKSVYISYLCLHLFVHMYLLPHSSSISIPVWIPQEWLESDRNRGVTVKYCKKVQSCLSIWTI